MGVEFARQLVLAVSLPRVCASVSVSVSWWGVGVCGCVDVCVCFVFVEVFKGCVE